MTGAASGVAIATSSQAWDPSSLSPRVAATDEAGMTGKKQFEIEETTRAQSKKTLQTQ